jgi:hypothetical protein
LYWVLKKGDWKLLTGSICLLIVGVEVLFDHVLKLPVPQNVENLFCK